MNRIRYDDPIYLTNNNMSIFVNNQIKSTVRSQARSFLLKQPTLIGLYDHYTVKYILMLIFMIF
jgi:hypothetical protein